MSYSNELIQVYWLYLIIIITFYNHSLQILHVGVIVKYHSFDFNPYLSHLQNIWITKTRSFPRAVVWVCLETWPKTPESHLTCGGSTCSTCVQRGRTRRSRGQTWLWRTTLSCSTTWGTSSTGERENWDTVSHLVLLRFSFFFFFFFPHKLKQLLVIKHGSSFQIVALLSQQILKQVYPSFPYFVCDGAT